MDNDSCLCNHEKTPESRLSLSQEVNNYCLFILPKPFQFSGRTVSPTFSVGSEDPLRSRLSFCHSTLVRAVLCAQSRWCARLLRALLRDLRTSLPGTHQMAAGAEAANLIFLNCSFITDLLWDHGNIPSAVLDTILSMGRCISGEKHSTRLRLSPFSPVLGEASARHSRCLSPLLCTLGIVLLTRVMLAWPSLWPHQNRDNMDQSSPLLFPCRAEGSCKSASFGSTADEPFSIISGYKASKSKVRGSSYTHTLRALSQTASIAVLQVWPVIIFSCLRSSRLVRCWPCLWL